MAALPNGSVPQDMLPVTDTGDTSVDYTSVPIDHLLNPTNTDPLASPEVGSPPKLEGSGGITAEQQSKAITDATAPLQQTLAEMQQRLMYLTGKLVEQNRAPVPATVPTNVQAVGPKEFTYDYDALATEMQTNAPQALVKYNQAYLAHVLPSLREELKRDILGDVNGQFTRRDQASSTHQAQLRDAQRAATEYPEVLANENGEVKFLDNDFANEAGREFYNNILSHTPSVADRVASGDQNWGVLARPGDFFSAISTVSARRLRTGKYPTSGQPTMPTQNGKLALREIINRNPPQDTNGTNRQTTDKPTTIDSFFQKPNEREFARRYAKQLGISEAAYVRQCAAASELEL